MAASLATRVAAQRYDTKSQRVAAQRAPADPEAWRVERGAASMPITRTLRS
ncbi:MAG: hypothetical protein ACF788_05260 [Novipirellula sp. JB048]